MAFSPASLHAQLMQLPVARRYCVAFSGGVDSHVLLHALVQIQDRLAGVTLHAIHIDHGLQPAATDWSRHCQTVCQRLGVSLDVRRVDVQRQSGLSLEAQAREARYRALAEMSRDGDLLLLAHHRDDQAETLLLQLLRGSGVKGLAAMPGCTPFAHGWLARPLLTYSRDELLAYARELRLQWIEDPTNLDPAFDRNFLRHDVIPVLRQRWPAISTSLARAASIQAEAAELLDQLAHQDLAGLQGPSPGVLQLAPLCQLPPVRQRNVLRYWLVQACGLPVPGAVQLQRILDEILTAADDATPLVHWTGAEVRRYRDNLYAMTPLTQIAPDWERHWDLQASLRLPLGDALRCRPAAAGGLRAALLGRGVEVRYRRGGERCHLPGRRHHHELKKLFQAWAVPNWQRDRIPLIYIGSELAQVVGFCVCAPFAAEQGEAGMEIIHCGRDDAIETADENKDNSPGCTP